MNVEYFEKAVSALLDRRPVRPFFIELVDGRRLEIDFPRAMSSRSGQAVFIAPGSIPILFDHEGVVAVIGDIAGTSA